MRKALFISQNSIRILLGLMFIASAVMKVLSLDTFVIYVYSFKIFSFVLTEIAARLLIAFEMVLLKKWSFLNLRMFVKME